MLDRITSGRSAIVVVVMDEFPAIGNGFVLFCFVCFKRAKFRERRGFVEGK